MSVRSFLDKLSNNDALVTIEKPVDVQYELANVANALSGKTVLFNNIKQYPEWRVIAGMCGDRSFFSMDLDVPVNDLTNHLANAIANPVLPPVVEQAPCQEVVLEQFDLNELPILLHLPEDAGHYIASNVVITRDPDFGRNMCYHRLLRLSDKHFAARIIERRGTHTAMQKNSRRSPRSDLHWRFPSGSLSRLNVSTTRDR